MNQSGIRVSDSLNKTVSNLPSDVRALKISIINESLEANGDLKTSGSFEEDFDRVQSMVEDSEAAYLLIREDDTKFVFASFVPDSAKVKDKMTYASTRNTLSRELGSSKFSSTYFATTKKELTYAAYAKHQHSENAEKPLSEKEKEIRDVKEAEGEVHNTSTKRAIVSSGVSFPMSESAQEALSVLKTASTSRMVSLTIDLKKETIELADDKEVDIDSLEAAIPSDAPRYTFYAYVHEYEGEGITTQCFIYTCPSSSKVKERMLYSSNRQSVTMSVSYKVDLKYESETLDLEDLKQRIHPAKVSSSAGFSRPKRPGKK